MQEEQCSSYRNAKGEIDAQLFESSNDCIKIIDLDGRLVLLNPGATEVLELEDRETLYGLEWISLWPADSHDKVNQALAAARAGGPARFSAFCPTAKGSSRWWDVIVSPMLDDQGRVGRIMAVSRDVTEVHLAKEALRNADRRKDEFLAVLAHELRNPLSTAGIAARLLETQHGGVDASVQLGKVIARQVGHMTRLVEDLIDVSRVSRGLVTLERIPLAMGEVVNEAIEQLQGAIDAKHHTLTFVPDAGNDTVYGDRTRLVQVVGNLLGNASRYTPDGGRINVELRRQANMVTLSIADNGIGIAAEKIPELFDLYSQVDRTSDRTNSGLGLGLALARSLAELHDGQVSAHSAGAGAGSTFELRLPAYL